MKQFYGAVIMFVTCFIMAACGPPYMRYKELPQEIYVYDSEVLGEGADQVIQAYNNSLGADIAVVEGNKSEEVFHKAMTSCLDGSCKDQASTTIISVQCDRDNKVEPEHHGICLMDDDGQGHITRAQVFIKCDHPWLQPPYAWWTVPHVIGHELYHCLGFYDHSSNHNCLNADPIPIDVINNPDDVEKNIESLFCQEMKDQFKDTYGERGM